MKVCPNCHTKYPDDGNFCPQEPCATEAGPRRLVEVPAGATELLPERFQLAARLGGGESGEVWQARDAESGGDVAFKLVAPGVFPTPTALERAQRELKQIMRAQNARVAKVIDFGKTQEGQLFVVTELINGETLEAMVQRTGPVPLERAKKIVAQIGEGLLEGQKVGVVHHDLSPKNVLLTSADDLKLINFVTPRPVSDTVFGVPEYLSPEQAEGKLVDQRSNTYSLGAIFYLLLTGEPPITGADPAAVLAAVRSGTVVPPGRRRPGFTPDVDRVVMKALEKSSSRRPLTMRQFLTEVATLSPPRESGSQATVAAGNRDVGFAQTMVFAGGSPEVNRLAAQANSARAEANGGGSPATFNPAVGVETPPPRAAAPEPAPAEPPQPVRRSHGAAVAATMVALPAAARGSSAPAAAAAPPPEVARRNFEAQETPPPQTGAPGKLGGAANANANFRETLWFKKGDVEQMVADAKAKAVAAARAKGAPVVAPVDPELPVEDVKPLEDRYVDDGSVTVEDRKKFSLRSGGTSTALPAAAGAVIPGERMSDTEMLKEIGGGKKIFIVVIAVAVVIAIITVLVVAFKGKDVDKSAAALVPTEKAVETPKPAAEPPAPAAPPPRPPAAAPSPPPRAAAPVRAAKAATAKKNTGPPKKKVAAKKKPATTKKKGN
jgi:hypothetical protein